MTGSERIGWLMFRYVRKELTEAEEKELSAWRNAHPNNESSFLSSTDTGHIELRITRMYERKERVLNRLMEKFPNSFIDPPLLKTPVVYKILRFAAAAAVTLGFYLYQILNPVIIETADLRSGTNEVGFFDEKGFAVFLRDVNQGFLNGWAGLTMVSDGNGDYIYYASSKDQASHELDYRLFTLPNGQMDLRFPDGYRVFLNGGSSIRYPRNLSQDSIKIFIEGEAWVELPKMTRHVLIFLNNTRIESEGAHFDAEAYPGDSLNRTTMVAGSARIAFHPKDSLQPTTLQLDAAREVVSNKEKIEVDEAVDTSATVSWKNGRTHFTNAGIQTIMRSVQHGYGVQVEYKGRIPDQKFSIDLPRKVKLRYVLDWLASEGLHYTIRGNTIIIL